MSLISIVIPTYNGERYIEETILSVLSQTSLPDEIIISDDNSTDTTIDICNKYNDKIKIYINSKGPSGFVNGWNKAINHAKGDFICILHQDDKLSLTFIEEIRKSIKEWPDVKHFFAACKYIDERNNIIEKHQPFINNKIFKFSGQEYTNLYELTPGHIHRCPGVVTHKSIFDLCKYRTEAGHIADDDFFLRVGNFTDVVGILKPLAFYREHKGSETGHLEDIQLCERLINDYNFQIRHSKDNPLISDDLLGLFKNLEYKYIKRFGGYSLKSMDLKNIIKTTIYFIRRILRN